MGLHQRAIEIILMTMTTILKDTIVLLDTIQLLSLTQQRHKKV